MKFATKVINIIALVLLSVYVNGRDAIVYEREVERVYISTDRDSYIAGEKIWLSLFCFDISGGDLKYSNLSSVGYVELHNQDRMVATAKISINYGRGGGFVDLPPDIPTGSYKLVAYTKYMLNEETLQLFQRDIPIVSPLIGAKIKDKVVIVEDYYDAESNSAVESNSEFIDVLLESNVFSTNSELKLVMNNLTDIPLSLSISVHRNDKIFSDNRQLRLEKTKDDLIKSGYSSFANRYTPEYEGEIIEGNVSFSGNPKRNPVISLAKIGEEIDLYFSEADASGSVTFYTNGLVNSGELIIEPLYSQEIENFNIEFKDPFINAKPSQFDSVLLSRSSLDVIEERMFEMQVARRYGLYNITENVYAIRRLLNKDNLINYRLDDYNRFITIRETVFEYIPDLRFRQSGGIYSLWALLYPDFTAYGNNKEYGTEKAMVFLDGIPIYDHTSIVEYDAYKVESIQVLAKKVYIDNHIFHGVVFINTFNGRHEDLKIDPKVKIIDYNAPQSASRLSHQHLTESNKIPDIRSLLYWDPVFDMSAKENREISIFTSSTAGEYCIEMEGIDENGEAIYLRRYFTVR